MDGGKTFHDVSAPANATVAVSVAVRPQPKRFFDTEMLSLNISGGSLPAGVMIRESPTRASLGQHCILALDVGFMVASMFDINLEVSVDGGQMWSPANAPVHVDYSALVPAVQ